MKSEPMTNLCKSKVVASLAPNRLNTLSAAILSTPATAPASLVASYTVVPFANNSLATPGKLTSNIPNAIGKSKYGSNSFLMARKINTHATKIMIKLSQPPFWKKPAIPEPWKNATIVFQNFSIILFSVIQ